MTTAKLLTASVTRTSAADGTTVDLGKPSRINIDDRVGQTDDTCTVWVDETLYNLAYGDDLTIRLNGGRERVFPVVGASRSYEPNETEIRCRRNIDVRAAAAIIRDKIHGTQGGGLGSVADEYFDRLEEDLQDNGYRNDLAQFIDEQGQSARTLSDWRTFLDTLAMEITSELDIVPINYVRGRVSLPADVPQAALRVEEDDLGLSPALVDRSDGDVTVMVRYVRDDGMLGFTPSDTKSDGTPRKSVEDGGRRVMARSDAPSFAASRAWIAAEYERLFKKSASLFFECVGNDDFKPMQLLDIGATHPEAEKWRYWRVNAVSQAFDLEREGWTTSVTCSPARAPA